MDNNSNKLFQEFVAPTTQEWIDKIQVDLKGADYQKRMVWRTNEGFDVQPFYRREDVEKLQTPDSLPGEFPFVRGNKKLDNEWYVRQNITANSAAEASPAATAARSFFSMVLSIETIFISKGITGLLIMGVNDVVAARSSALLYATIRLIAAQREVTS